jgi:hypothetical protein
VSVHALGAHEPALTGYRTAPPDDIERRPRAHKERTMGLSGSLILIAIGAILRFAVTAQTEGIDLNTVGMILMIVGAVGAVLSLVFWSSWGGFGGRGTRDTY